MRLPENQTARTILSKAYVSDFLAYIDRKKKRFTGQQSAHTTVADLARRFRLKTTEIQEIIDRHGSEKLSISNFVFKAAQENSTLAAGLYSLFVPEIEEEAALGRRLVITLTTKEEEERNVSD